MPKVGVRALVAVALIGVVVAVAIIAERQRASADSGRECLLQKVERSRFPKKPPKPLALNPESTAGINIAFGRTRVTPSEIFYLSPEDGFLTDRDIPLNLRKRPLRRQEVTGAIMPGDYEAVALITGAAEVTLRLCVPASTAIDVDPGTYTGGVVIADRRVETTNVAVTVSLQYRSFEWFTIIFGVMVLLLGAGSVWAAGRRAKSGDVFEDDWHRDFGRWFVANLIAVALGAIAATSAWVASYWRNPSWGAKAPEDWFTLLGAMFAAFTAAVTAASRAGGTQENVVQVAQTGATRREDETDRT